MSRKFFIFVACYLFFSISLVCNAGDNVNWGDLWGDMSSENRSFYLLGYRDGLQVSAGAARHGKVIDSLGFSDAVMAAAVSDLYGDKKNSGIPVNLMVIIARDKLLGFDVREALRKQRLLVGD